MASSNESPPKKKKKTKSFKFTAYLAGPMEYSSDAGLVWRKAYQKRLERAGIKCIIPNEEESKVEGSSILKEIKSSNLPKYVEIMRNIIKLDLELVDQANCLVVKWDGETIAGTIHEVGHAYEKGIPCFLVTRLTDQEIPGWFLALFDAVFAKPDDLAHHILAALEPGVDYG
jgi:nucleoside 2-deoxyribosyltransferase